MILGIPTDDGTHVSAHFGHSKYFLIIDTNSHEKKLVENPHEKEENEAAGHGKLLKMLVQNKVNKVICANLSQKMEGNLSSLKIEIQKVNEGTDINILNLSSVSGKTHTP